MTYLEYRAAVVADILEQMNSSPDGEGVGSWSKGDAEACVGDVSDMQSDGLSPRDAANEILYVAAQG